MANMYGEIEDGIGGLASLLKQFKTAALADAPSRFHTLELGDVNSHFLILRWEWHRSQFALPAAQSTLDQIALANQAEVYAQIIREKLSPRQKLQVISTLACDRSADLGPAYFKLPKSLTIYPPARGEKPLYSAGSESIFSSDRFEGLVNSAVLRDLALENPLSSEIISKLLENNRRAQQTRVQAGHYED